MLEVSKMTVNKEDFLKIKLKSLDAELVSIVTSIEGWFKANEPSCYGLPYSALGEFIQKTGDVMVVWKSSADSMGSLVRGINTKDIPNTYAVKYKPKIELREHQIKTFNLMSIRDCLLIADQEGVGKTPPIMCQHEAKCRHKAIKWGLYVTKAGLVYDVKNQAEKFTHMRVAVIEGTPSRRVKLYHEIEREKYDLVVVSYETYRTDINHFISVHQEKPFDVMYLDEAHKIKSTESRLGKVIHYLDTPQRYAITASPVINEIIDMFNILNWLGVLNYNLWQFRQKFCVMDGFGVKSYKNVGEIKKILQSNMLRRLKNDVLKDLPPVVPKNVYVEMTASQKRIYKAVRDSGSGKYRDEILDDLEFEDIPTELSKYARLAQVAESTEIVGGQDGVKGSAKLQELEYLLEEIVERNEKAVVFSRSKRFTLIMAKYFKRYNPAIIHGEISAHAKTGQEVSDRQAQVDKFQEDSSCKVIFCTEAASREGWTGTEGNNVIFTSKPWSPAYVSQCIGRVWRFGAQKHKSINVYTLISRGTVDERVEMLLQEKQFTIDSTVEQPLGTGQILEILEGGDVS